MLSKLTSQFATFQPKLLALPRPEAGVLVPVLPGDEPAILLTVRARHLKSHPGDVAFPGGMREPSDRDLATTALRETEEELNLPRSTIEILGRLSTGLSKNGIQVNPFVGLVTDLSCCRPSPDEIAEWFTVPWAFFAQQEPEFQPVQRHGIRFHIPHYQYGDKHIWGLTAMILLELVNLLEGTTWPVPAFTDVAG
ncbi:MAG: NUDIX hydrolase [Saccharospirillum sp.]